MKRKSPIRHVVHQHLRKNRPVHQYWRGHGVPIVKRRVLSDKAIGKYVLASASYLTNWHPESQKLVWMSPLEFLRLAGTPEVWDQSSLKKLKLRMEKGLDIDPLFLDVIYNSGQVITHEGRHRAKAAIELGIKEVPVILYHRDSESGYVPIKGQHKYSEPLTVAQLKSQRPELHPLRVIKQALKGKVMGKISEQELISYLQKITPDLAYYDGRVVSVRFGDSILTNRIEVVPHELYVGNWHPIEDVVIIDKDLTPERWRKSISVHEALEKHFYKQYGLNPKAEGHQLADDLEKRWFLQRYPLSDWHKYSDLVKRIHRARISDIVPISGKIKTDTKKELRQLLREMMGKRMTKEQIVFQDILRKKVRDKEITVEQAHEIWRKKYGD